VKYGNAMTFIEFRSRRRCRNCGSGDVGTLVDSRLETPGERWEREAREGEPSRRLLANGSPLSGGLATARGAGGTSWSIASRTAMFPTERGNCSSASLRRT
jgi:hypothetical protein